MSVPEDPDEGDYRRSMVKSLAMVSPRDELKDKSDRRPNHSLQLNVIGDGAMLLPKLLGWSRPA